VFTKGLGTGVISTAIKARPGQQSWIDAATKSMTTSTPRRRKLLLPEKFEVHAATDVTGFG